MKLAITALEKEGRSSLYCASRLYLREEHLVRVVAGSESAGLKLVHIYENFNEYPAPLEVARDIRASSVSGDGRFLRSSLNSLNVRDVCFLDGGRFVTGIDNLVTFN